MADADAMAGACAAAGVVFAGGALTKAYPEVQEAAARLAAGVYGAVVGASVHGWSSEILGAGCQHTSVLRLLTGAEVTAVVAWCEQPDGLRDGDGRLVDAVDGAEVSLPHPPARVSALSDHCALWCMPSSCLWLRRPTGPCVLALLSRARMRSLLCWHCSPEHACDHLHVTVSVLLCRRSRPAAGSQLERTAPSSTRCSRSRLA